MSLFLFRIHVLISVVMYVNVYSIVFVVNFFCCCTLFSFACKFLYFQ